ncbi:unnamed protein product [Oppiella nova]|uniref:U1 small nuclear ribonucleoprotein C n=1 Tax=Oppiella nova TaxID=334625 RepID=A0A7R9LP67_9ACAR|nr:unnamed protein product [Oppiella nova]CAG2164957.1 unnamed protein product [Oppiella nova]
MPKYYCDYCDTFLTHDSVCMALTVIHVTTNCLHVTTNCLCVCVHPLQPSVRKTHCNGRKHKENVNSAHRWRQRAADHSKWDHLSNQAAAFKASKALSSAFAGVPKPPPGAILPPPPPLPPGARFPVAGGRLPIIPNVPPPPLPPGAGMTGMMIPPPLMPGMRPPTGPPPNFAPPPSLAAIQALQSAQQRPPATA